MVNYPKDWEVVKLGAALLPYNGLSGKNGNDFSSGNEKFITYLSVFNDKVIEHGKGTVNIKPNEVQNIVKYGDILFTQSSETIEEVGMASTYYGTEKVFLNSFCFGTRKVIELDSFFLVSLLRSRSIRNKIIKEGQGSTRYNISPKRLLSITVTMPKFYEQKIIAETLTAFDEHIENLEELIAKKKMIRDGAVEDLMSGKTRLDGFDGKWETVKLKDVISTLKSGLSRELSQYDIGLPVVRANNIEDGLLYLEKNIKYWYREDPKGANTTIYHIKRNDILVNFINSEAKMGTATIVKNKPKRDTIYTTNILRMRIKESYDPYFIFYITFLSKYKDYIKDISKIAVNQASFTTVDYKEFEFSIPTKIEEQKAIADILTAMDEEIEDLRQEKDKIEKIKAGAMDDLLTGKIRLVKEA